MSPAVVLVAAIVAARALVPWSQDADAPPLVLTITYPGGRSVPHVVTRRPQSAWTPLFSRSGNWRSPEGLTVTAVSYKYRLVEAGVRVDISVLLGQPHQKELAVTTVVVGQDEPSHIDRLRDFGVEPVVLSVVPFVPSTLYQPQVENKTAALQVEDVEIVTSSSPGYRVTVRNYSLRPVLTFHVETYEGAQPRSAARHGYRDGTPAVASGGTFSFRIDADRTRGLIRITGLMFEDGTIEGDAEGVHLTGVVYAGRRRQLQRVLAVFGRATRAPVADPAATIASLAAQIEALSVVSDANDRQWAAGLLPRDGLFTSAAEAVDGAFSSALREVRNGVLSDLKSSPREPVEFERWLKEITALYQKWYFRFIELTAR